MSYLWSRWDGAELPKPFIMSWGFSERTVEGAILALVHQGIIERIRPAAPSFHRGTTWNIPHDLRRTAAALSQVHYQGFADWTLRPRRRQSIVGLPPTVAQVVRTLAYDLDMGAAYDLTWNLPPDQRQRKWAGLSRIPSGTNIKPDWSRSQEVGRLYCSRPALQTIPRGYRRPDILLTDELHQVDFHAQHSNMLRVLGGHDPIPDTWDRIADATGQAKPIIKEVVNAAIGGQTRNQWAWGKMYEGQTPDLAAYDAIAAEAVALGINPSPWADLSAWTSPYTGNDLQVLGASVMDAVLLYLHRDGAMPDMLLPMHDGLIIGGREDDAEVVLSACQRASYEVLGRVLPVKVD